MKKQIPLLCAFFAFAIACTTVRVPKKELSSSINFPWFKNQLAFIQAKGKEVNTAEFILQTFIKEHGKSPFATPALQSEFESHSTVIQVTQQALTALVGEYNARANAEFSVLFNRENLPPAIHIQIQFTFEAPLAPPPQRSLSPIQKL